MRRISILIAAVTFGMSPAGAYEFGDAENGLLLAETLCAGCHALGTEGESPLEDAPPFREIATLYPIENLQEALAEGIVVAHDSPMPQFEFSADEIDDILAYLAELGDS